MERASSERNWVTIAVFLIPIYTVYLGPVGFGKIETLLALTGVLVIVLRLGITSAFFRLLTPYTVCASGGSSGDPSGRVTPREARKLLVPSSRDFPST